MCDDRVRSLPTFRIRWIGALAGVVLAIPSAPAAEVLEYTSGHGDLEVRLIDGHLRWSYYLDSDVVLSGQQAGAKNSYQPGEIAVRVTDQGGVRQTAGAYGQVASAFIGDVGGDYVWTLPQLQNPSAPWLGLGAETLNPQQWTEPVRVALADARMPVGGDFSLWARPGAEPWAFLSTFDPAATLDSDHHPGPNRFTLPMGSHGHYNWSFTQAGLYDITLTAEGVHQTAGAVSDTATFRFVVGDATAVPEASVWPLLLVGVACVWVGLRRRPARSGRPVALGG